MSESLIWDLFATINIIPMGWTVNVHVVQVGPTAEDAARQFAKLYDKQEHLDLLEIKAYPYDTYQVAYYQRNSKQ